MKLNNILKIALIAPLLVACGESDEFDGNAGGVATFSGTIDGVNTRMYNDEWEEEDAIGVSVVTAGSATTGSNVKYITADGDGTFSPDSAKITYGDKNSVDFAAYYPYDENLPEDGIIKFTSAPIRDYMFAKGSGKSSKPNVKFQFSHVMSQVVLNLTAGTGVKFSGTIGLSLGNIIQDGSFNTLTGDVTLTEKATASSMSASLNLPSGYETTSIVWSLNFLPQTLSTLDLELTIDGTTYAATLSLPTVDDEQGLLAGRSVSYDITVNKSSLNASNGTIVGWTKDEGSFTSGKLGTHMADEAQLYDLAFSDGSFVSVWPEGVSKDAIIVGDNLTKLQNNINNLNSNQSAGVVGIVYWTGDPTTDDGLLQTDYPGCKHGLILALKDLHTATIKWQDQEYENYSVSEQIENWDSNLKPQSNESISINFDEGSNVDNTANVEQLNKILGYNNTKLLRAYNYYYSDCDHKVRPIEYLDLFIAGNKAPEGSSGWFLPSPKELVLITKSDGDVSFHTGSSSLQYQNIQNILETLSNASKMSLNSSMQKYWSSSEGKSPTYYKTLYVNINFGGYVYYLEKNNAYATARAVCAF
jgi:hypothetical protein